jgi:hypothetical protein
MLTFASQNLMFPVFRSMNVHVSKCGLAQLFLCLAVAAAVPAHADNILVGPGGQPASFADAARLAKDGDTIDVLPGEYPGEVVVFEQKKLTIRGLGKRPVFIGAGRSGEVKNAEGKALWVLRDGDFTVENIEFRGARASDANGAGIRFEKGRLKVLRSAFFDNENGILTSNAGDAELDIVDSEFGNAPMVVGGLHHLLYAGRIARLTVTGSRFHSGFEGHLIKSRARETRLAYNMINDGPQGRASYEVDLPNGGMVTLIGNVIGQGANTENPVVVSYGAEGRAWERNVLVMAHNTLLNDGWLPAWFLRVFRDRLPEGTEVHAVNNLTVGAGVFTLGASGHFEGNYPALRDMLVDADTFGFDLDGWSRLRGRGVDPTRFAGQNLSPTAEFDMPVGTRPLPPLNTWNPGAMQKR